jgi:hypothetical protein
MGFSDKKLTLLNIINQLSDLTKKYDTHAIVKGGIDLHRQIELIIESYINEKNKK